MVRKIEAVIFDLDGVIADTFELHYQANKKIANEIGVSFSLEDNDRFKGISRMEIIESLTSLSKGTFNEYDKKILAESKNNYYQQLIDNLDHKSILPGIKPFIEDLESNGIMIGLASSSTNGKTVLSKLNLLHHFKYIVDPRSLKKGKPDPEIFLKAADMLEVPYKNCVAIEDGEAGLKAIKKTEMFSIGVGNSPGMNTADWHVVSTEEITLKKIIERFRG
jgi:beta-phosphoglucomutase